MPIYEFYCRDCHTVFNFFARTMNTTKVPGCPKCPRAKLERRMSSFAISKGRTEDQSGGETPGDLPGNFDEAGMESLMEELGRDAESLDENDPRQMARVMRKLFEKTGMPLNETMREAMRRMEAGEDPDKIEEELGDAFDSLDDPTAETAGEGASKPSGKLKHGWVRRLKPPQVDDTLYDL